MDGEEQQTGQLVTMAAAGDQEAWRTLVHRHAALVWTVARSHRLGDADADDVCQTTWLRLAERLGTLRQPGRLPAWLITTARRESLRVLAARRREVPLELDVLGRVAVLSRGIDDDPGGAEARLVRADRSALLWRAFAGMPERCQRLLWVLAFTPELSYAQTARLLGMPSGSIGPSRGRCLRQLRRRLLGFGCRAEVA